MLNPHYCVTASTPASTWFLQSFENAYNRPLFAWTVSANEAFLFWRHEEAVAIAQIVKHLNPELSLKILQVRHSGGAQ